MTQTDDEVTRLREDNLKLRDLVMGLATPEELYRRSGIELVDFVLTGGNRETVVCNPLIAENVWLRVLLHKYDRWLQNLRYSEPQERERRIRLAHDMLKPEDRLSKSSSAWAFEVPDPDILERIADHLDKIDLDIPRVAYVESDDVIDDLRRWARSIREATQ